MYKYFLGLKYLTSRPINLLGAIGITIAVWALIVIVSVFSGFIKDVRAQLRGAAPALSMLDDSLQTSYAAVEKILLADPDVQAVAPRIVWHGLIYPEFQHRRDNYVRVDNRDTRGTNYYRVIGIDYAKECSVSPIAEWLDAVGDRRHRVSDPKHPFDIDPKRYPKRKLGEFGHPPPGILIGRTRTIARAGTDGSIAVGHDMTLASAWSRDGKIKSVKRDFVMAGAYFAGRFHEVEGTDAFVDIDELRGVFGHDKDDPDSLDVFTEISIALHDESQMGAVARRLNDRLRAAQIPGAVVTWEQRQKRFLDAVDHERGVMKVVLFVVMVVASFLIFATVSMMVTKKTRDIGVIAALGGTRRGVLAIFLVSGSVIAILGTGFGLVAGWLSVLGLNSFNAWLFATFGVQFFPSRLYGAREIPYVLDPAWFVQVAIGAVICAILFSLLPALRAARLDPVQALRYE